jgi:seryl-tRNA synthetase
VLRKERGGDPELIRKSQRERFADETLVDKVIELDDKARTAKYNLDCLNKEKNDISKIVKNKKTASKGQDKCEEEIAHSKSIDEKIAEQKRITVEVVAE